VEELALGTRPRLKAAMIDFIGIGAQKAGTAWLHANLRVHPEVWLPKQKELHFFDRIHGSNIRRVGREVERKRRVRIMSESQYIEIFSAAPDNTRKGEITPAYCALGLEGILHMKRMFPKVRLIYIIRDPVSRALSSMRMRLERGRSKQESLLKVLEKRAFLARGDYRLNIPLWDEAFGSQMVYLPFGWIKSHPDRLLRAIESAIGVSEFSGYPKITEVMHPTKKAVIDPAIEGALRKTLAPQYSFLEERFGIDFLRDTQ
jgi:hypothetical protein